MQSRWQILSQQLMFPQLGSAVLETILNQLIKRSHAVQPHLKRLAGKVLKLEIREPNIAHYLVFSTQQVDILHQFDTEVDCHVITSANVLLPPPSKEKISQLINQQQIVLHGNLDVLQDFIGLLESFEKDPAELISPYVGDVIAYNGVRIIQQTIQWLKNGKQDTQNHLSECLSEEWQLTMPVKAISSFQREIMRLEIDSDNLLDKIELLEKRIEEKYDIQ